ncbi:hypothetical protein [Actinobacillus arthritidis]|uniref:hypothetical protein n=1 Tax=Actinobacillus arthritidis TaxID=157339 RepID=UPI002441BCC1|nr:hypothetical protein [Actinobacillus arthritidis]WGE89714.1 hypothetical protein NYR89_01920 [Actinobacillus arthritidis]
MIEKTVIEYYQYTFLNVHKKYDSLFQNKIENTKQEIRSQIKEITINNFKNSFDSTESWDFLNSILPMLEEKMKNIISKHSILYWFHLYRRVGVGSITNDDEFVNPTVLSHIRCTIETAFYKYGKIECGIDIAKGSDMNHKMVLGGLFYKDLKKKGVSNKQIKELYHRYEKTYMLKNYSHKNHEDIYVLECYSYYYWKIMAKMRAVSKGAKLYIDENGEPKEIRDNSLNRLILSYDKRSEIPQTYSSFSKGIISYHDVKNINEDIIFSCHYNYNRDVFPELLSDDFAPNFLPNLLNIKSILSAVNILKEPFLKKYGYTLDSYLTVIQLLSFYYISNRATDDNDNRVHMYGTLQRGYFITEEGTIDNMVNTLSDYNNDLNNKSYQILSKKDIKTILSDLTLSNFKRENISLWSYGPLPILVTCNNLIYCDIGHLEYILSNIFFGLRENHAERGGLFEKYIKEKVKETGVEILDIKYIKNTQNDKYRETDIAIRIRDNLILCDCKSIEKPIDFIKGTPKTVNKRNEIIKEKIDSILSIKDFVEKNKLELNHDLTWVKKFVSIGITADVEWIDSEDSKLWINDNYPILMSVKEFFNFIDSLKNDKLKLDGYEFI